MYIKDLHPWNITPSKATQIQNQLRNQIIDTDDLGEIQFVAGMDIGFNMIHGSDAAETAQFEIGLWFPEGLNEWTQDSLSWVYE